MVGDKGKGASFAMWREPGIRKTTEQQRWPECPPAVPSPLKTTIRQDERDDKRWRHHEFHQSDDEWRATLR